MNEFYLLRRRWWILKRKWKKKVQESDSWWCRLLRVFIPEKSTPGQPHGLKLRFVLLLYMMIVYPIYALILAIQGRMMVPVSGSDPIRRFTYALLHPVPDPYVFQNAMPSLLTGTLIWWLVVMSMAGARRRTPGREYGQAKFLSGHEVTRVLGDEDLKQEKILGMETRISVNDRMTGLNNNALIIGGTGAGKTFYFLTPNAFQCFGSYIFTDPKGEILRDKGNYFRRMGYKVKVLNLVEMDRSDHYNPFAYIRSNTDVVRLINILIKSTTPPRSHTSDPFWERAEAMLLQSLFFYVWLEPSFEGKRNFSSVLELLKEADVPEKAGQKSKLDLRMDQLAAADWTEYEEKTGKEITRKGTEHPAYVAYMMARKGAADTVRSIIISANARLAFIANTPAVLDILSSDDMEIPCLGMGYRGNLQKTVLFCVIPDADTTFNAIVAMLYSQIFQTLYFEADQHTENGRLPIPVSFWLDEYANVRLPDDFPNLLSTMRSRGISANIIIQNLAQLKSIHDKVWETVPGNCDSLI